MELNSCVDEVMHLPPPLATNRKEVHGAMDYAILVSFVHPTGKREEIIEGPLTAKAMPRRLEGHHFGLRSMNHVQDNVYTVVSVRFAAFNVTCW
jgi:hypothetical protein